MEAPLHTRTQVKHLTKFRAMAALNLLLLLYFFYYRLCEPSHPGPNLIRRLALTCESLFAIAWILDCVCAWFQIDRRIYVERLLSSKQFSSSQLPNIDVFVTAADPWKEPPLVVANTVVSVLAAEYERGRLACYLSDDGGSPFTFFALLQAHQFAKKWVPFCKRYSIRPRAPVPYFAAPLHGSPPDVRFTAEWNDIQREYEGFKSNLITAMKTQRIPREVQILFEGLSRGSAAAAADPADHPGMIKVLADPSLPLLVYVAREKRLGFEHHSKAGALNALLRASGVMTKGWLVLNLDCDMYVNDPQALYQALCFYADTTPFTLTHLLGFVQFPQRFWNAGGASDLSFLFDVIYRGLDGLQGPFCVGTGCIFRREALYGYTPPKLLEGPQDRRSETSLDDGRRRFGECWDLISSAVGDTDASLPDGLRSRWSHEDVVSVISCEYEGGTEWGREVGWMYGTSTEDIMTGIKVHSRGWRSIYFNPKNPTFICSMPTHLIDMIKQQKRWALGMLEILLNKKAPIYCYGGLMPLQWLAYLHACFRNLYSVPIFLYTSLPTFALLTGKSFTLKIWNKGIIIFISISLSMKSLDYLQHKWIKINAKDWWNGLVMNNIFMVTSSLGATCEMTCEMVTKLLLRTRYERTFFVTPKSLEDKIEAYGLMFDGSWLFLPPIMIVLINIVGLTMGAKVMLSSKNGYDYIGEVILCCWILINLYPIVNGLIKKEKKGGFPKSLILKTFLLVFILLIHPLMYSL